MAIRRPHLKCWKTKEAEEDIRKASLLLGGSAGPCARSLLPRGEKLLMRGMPWGEHGVVLFQEGKAAGFAGWVEASQALYFLSQLLLV